MEESCNFINTIIKLRGIINMVRLVTRIPCKYFDLCNFANLNGISHRFEENTPNPCIIYKLLEEIEELKKKIK